MTDITDTVTTVEHYGKKFSFSSSPEQTAYEYIEEVIEPLMIAMGYHPLTVYTTTNNIDMLDSLKESK